MPSFLPGYLGCCLHRASCLNFKSFHALTVPIIYVLPFFFLQFFAVPSFGGRYLEARFIYLFFIARRFETMPPDLLLENKARYGTILAVRNVFCRISLYFRKTSWASWCISVGHRCAFNGRTREGTDGVNGKSANCQLVLLIRNAQ